MRQPEHRNPLRTVLKYTGMWVSYATALLIVPPMFSGKGILQGISQPEQWVFSVIVATTCTAGYFFLDMRE